MTSKDVVTNHVLQHFLVLHLLRQITAAPQAARHSSASHDAASLHNQSADICTLQCTPRDTGHSAVLQRVSMRVTNFMVTPRTPRHSACSEGSAVFKSLLGSLARSQSSFCSSRGRLTSDSPQHSAAYPPQHFWYGSPHFLTKY